MSATYHLFIRFVAPEGLTDDDLDVAIDSTIRELAGGEITDFILEEQDA